MQHIWERRAGVHNEPTFEPHCWSTQVSPVHPTLASVHNEPVAPQLTATGRCGRQARISKHRAISQELCQPFPPIAVGNFKEIPVVSYHCRAGGIQCVHILERVNVYQMPNTMRQNQTVLTGAFPSVDRTPSTRQRLEGFVWLAIAGEPRRATRSVRMDPYTSYRKDGRQVSENGRWRELVKGRGIQHSSKNRSRECFISVLTGMPSGDQKARLYWKDGI